MKVPMAFAHLPLCKIAALGRNAANISYVVSLPTTGGESMLVEFSGANPYRCFWTLPAVVIFWEGCTSTFSSTRRAAVLIGTTSTALRTRDPRTSGTTTG